MLSLNGKFFSIVIGAWKATLKSTFEKLPATRFLSLVANWSHFRPTYGSVMNFFNFSSSPVLFAWSTTIFYVRIVFYFFLLKWINWKKMLQKFLKILTTISCNTVSSYSSARTIRTSVTTRRHCGVCARHVSEPRTFCPAALKPQSKWTVYTTASIFTSRSRRRASMSSIRTCSASRC